MTDFLNHWDLLRHSEQSDYGPDAYTLWPDGAIIKGLSAASASLIRAAAPMLTALQACELQLREYVHWHHANAGGCSVEIETAWEQARDAIAKTTEHEGHSHDTDYFIGKSGKRYAYADVAQLLRDKAPQTLGKHISIQLAAVELLEEMQGGITPCGLPFSFA